MWSRWKAGQSLHAIGRAFGKDTWRHPFSVGAAWRDCSAARRRSPRTLTLAEREDISRGIASGWSIREIAKGLQAGGVDGEPRGRPPWRATSLSSQ